MERQNLWAPWRMDYIKSADESAKGGCFLCDAWNNPAQDPDRLVIHRNAVGMILLNRYPYTNGHLLVALGQHLPDLAVMNHAQRCELTDLTALAQRVIQTALNCQGMNIGINLGRCAGAGLPGHLHVHLVPRWSGDTNFMDVVGQVRVIPQALEQIQAQFTAVLTKLAAGE